MSVVLEIALVVLAIALLVPTVVLFAECVAALGPPRERRARTLVSAVRVTVMIPAHNEGRVLKRTLEQLRPELGEHDRLLVIADNCTDRTPELAREAGAEVIERFDPARRGKGFALDFGIEHLALHPPDVVVVLDADCRVERGSIRRLAECAMRHHGPAQAEDLLTVPDGASPVARISALAFLVRNHVRSTGLRRLGLPCHLMGTGMAFPWDVLRAAPPGGSHLAEDIQMGIELSARGFPPVYCEGARITSLTPKRSDAARGQRRRWEHGHLATMLEKGPRLIRRGVRERRLDLVAMGFDLMVPPLALLVLMILAGVALTAGFAVLGGSSLPFALFTSALALVLAAVFAGWLRFGRSTLPGRYLLLAPFYVLWKVPLYLSFVARGPHRAWERAERSASSSF